jgi:hypothetical protein
VPPNYLKDRVVWADQPWQIARAKHAAPSLHTVHNNLAWMILLVPYERLCAMHSI